jgi:hypothetical protein
VEVLLLIGVGVFVAAALFSALSGLSYPWVGMIGVVLGLGLWIAAAIVIFRGPDNPDLGEGGWTMVVGVLLALYVGVWLLGSAVGRVLRTRSTRGTSVAA